MRLQADELQAVQDNIMAAWRMRRLRNQKDLRTDRLRRLRKLANGRSRPDDGMLGSRSAKHLIFWHSARNRQVMVP